MNKCEYTFSLSNRVCRAYLANYRLRRGIRAAAAAGTAAAASNFRKRRHDWARTADDVVYQLSAHRELSDTLSIFFGFFLMDAPARLCEFSTCDSSDLFLIYCYYYCQVPSVRNSLDIHVPPPPPSPPSCFQRQQVCNAIQPTDCQVNE